MPPPLANKKYFWFQIHLLRGKRRALKGRGMGVSDHGKGTTIRYGAGGSQQLTLGGGGGGETKRYGNQRQMGG